MTTTGSQLRAARSTAGLSLRELADRAKTSAATLSMYETGIKEPRLSTLTRLIDAAGADLVIKVQPRLSQTERRSLELHRAVADKLQANPARVLAKAKMNLKKLRRIHSDRAPYPYFDTWDRFLSGQIDELLRVLTSPAQSARDLRSSSPFAGVLTEAERQRVLARVGVHAT
jgi:transcriptional regulator with XRE-family HTH domain